MTVFATAGCFLAVERLDYASGEGRVLANARFEVSPYANLTWRRIKDEK